MKNNQTYYVYSSPWLAHESGILFTGTYTQCQEYAKGFSGCVDSPSILPLDEYFFLFHAKKN